VNTQVVNPASGGCVALIFGMLFTPTASSTVMTWCKDGFNQYTATTCYDSLAGQSGALNGVETDAQHKMQIAATLRNLGSNIDTFTSVTATVKIRIGGANGNQSITPSGTGQIVDASDTDAVSAGSLVDTVTNVSSGTDTNFGQAFTTIDCVGSTAQVQYMSAYGLAAGGIGVFSANSTTYAAISTRLRTNATESLVHCKTATAFTASHLQGYVTANTITGNTVISFRVAGANGNESITFGSDATGWVTDSSDTDSVTATTEIDHAVVVPNSGTSINFTNISFTATYAATALTLSAAAGSYATTGAAATLAGAATIVTAEGSYGLTGIAANLAAAGSMAGAAGLYVTTGDAANLYHARLDVGTAGSYGVTGDPATLATGGGVTMVTATGVYALTGAAATLSEAAGGTPTPTPTPTPTSTKMILNTISKPIQPAPIYQAGGLTAIGTTQATGFPLTPNTRHEFTTVGSGVATLPVADNFPCEVSVADVDTVTLTVYPPVGGTIDNGAVNAPATVASNSGASWWAAAPLTYHSMQSAAAGAGSGTVTQVATGAGLSGGPISTTGTVAIAALGVATGMIAGSAVTYGKIQNVAASSILGNPTGSPAAPVEIGLGANLSFSGTNLVASGGGGGGAGTVNSGTAGQVAYYGGTGTAVSGQTLSALIDAAIESGSPARGDTLYRGASLWLPKAAGTAHNPWETGGSGADPDWNSFFLLPSAGPTRYATGPFFNIVGPGTAVANTVAQTSLFTGATLRSGQSLMIAANSLIAGQTLRMFLTGTGSVTGAPTLTFYLMFGGAVIAQSSANTISTNLTGAFWWTNGILELIFPTIGATGTCIGMGTAQIFTSVNAATSFSMANGAGTFSGTPATANTTQGNLVDVQIAWGTAAAGNSWQLTGGWGEIIG
jgi:hypothetical protein